MEDVEKLGSMIVVRDKQRDLEEDVIKSKIVSELSGLHSNTTFVASLLEPGIPQQPLVKVAGYGRVSLPVNEQTASVLETFMEKTACGLGGKQEDIKTVRSSSQGRQDKFTIENDKFSEAISTKVVASVKQQLGLHEEMEVSTELFKLLLCKPGGNVKLELETKKSHGVFGTLIVQLPSEFTGGDLTVSHAGRNVVINMCQEGSSSFCVVAFYYSDCEFDLHAVASGYRLVLVYNLTYNWCRVQTPAPSAGRLVDRANILQSLVVDIMQFLLVRYTNNREKMPRMCWGLEHQYSDNDLQAMGVRLLRGVDRSVVETLVAVNQKMDLKEKYVMFLAKAVKETSMDGMCSGIQGYRYCSLGGRCGDDDCESVCSGSCFYKDKGSERSVSELTNFVSLTGDQLAVRLGR